MKFNRKTISNIIFVVLIGLLLYPPTKVYFIRLVSFAPSTITEEKREELADYNWKLKGLNTETVDFNSLKEKVVFVNFWATWCPPCVAEMPSIQKLYDDYKDKVAFVFISNEDWTTIDTFYKDKGYCWILNQEELNQKKIEEFFINIFKNRQEYENKKLGMKTFKSTNSWINDNGKILHAII